MLLQGHQWLYLLWDLGPEPSDPISVT
jgi:hypothetical protein